MPPAEAREVQPGTYVLHLGSRLSPGRAVEEIRGEIFLVETFYDETGRETGTSVPSMAFSHLTAEQRTIVAGMRSGDRRRIWRCPRGRASTCTVEDLQLFDGDE